MKFVHLFSKLMLVVSLVVGMFGCSQTREVTPDPTQETRSSGQNYGGPTDIVNSPSSNGPLFKSLCHPQHGEMYCTDQGKLSLKYTRDYDAIWDKDLDDLNGTYIDFLCEIDGYFLNIYSPYRIENISDYWSAPEVNATKFYKVKPGIQVNHKKLDALDNTSLEYIMGLKNNSSEELKNGVITLGALGEIYVVFTTDSNKKSPSTRGKIGVMRISNYIGKGILTIEMWKEK